MEVKSNRYSHIMAELTLFGVSHGIWLIFLVLFVVGAIFIPGFLKVENVINVFWGNVAFGLMVLGMFVVLLTGNVDLSVESIFAIAPIIGACMMVKWFPGVVSPPLAIIITLVIGLGAGLANAFLSIYLGINSFLVTLTMLLVLRGFSEFLIPEGLYYLPEGFVALGKTKILGFPIALIVFVAAAIVIYFVTKKTVMGKDFYAVGSSDRAAFLAGVNVKKARLVAFVMSGFFAALGGLISTGRMQAVIADMGSGDVMMVFAACFLGGASMSGGRGEVIDILGAIFALNFIMNILNLQGVNPYLINVIYGLILLLAIIFANMQQGFRERLLLATATKPESH